MPKSLIFVIPQQNFRDEELVVPQKILVQRRVSVRVAAPSTGPARGSQGSEVTPNLALAQVKPSDFDGIVFVGGQGSVALMTDDQLMRLAQEFAKAGKIVGAICHASGLLANAGLLIGKRATGNLDEEQLLLQCGSEYTGLQAEIDGRIVTGKDSSAAAEFGEALCQVLEV